MAKDESKKTPELKPRKVKVIRALSDAENKKLRVAAYCRVSTDSEDQVNSFIAQVKYYNDFIRLSDTMELVDIYADEGITGTSTEKRDEFNRMIRDCKLGKIDRVFVKSVSRFARNSLECIENIRLLKSYGTNVLFENDGLDTSNMNSEMILYIKSAFAQSESLSGSKRVSTAIRMRMETGKFVTTTAPYGYRLEDKKLVIYPAEAETVRRIFDMYLHGYGISKIILALKESNPERIWTKEHIRYILRNEKYVGDSLYQKSFTPSVFPLKNIRNRGEVDQYYVSDTHGAIIDKETFEKVKIMLDKNLEKYEAIAAPKKRNYTGVLFCSDCGWAYKPKHPKDIRRWVCSQSGNAGRSCNSTPITESDLEKTFISFYNRLKQHENIIIHKTLSQLTDLKRRITVGSDGITAIDREIAALSDENSMYVRFYQQEMMDEVTYREQTGTINKRISELRSRRQKLLREDEDEACIDVLRKMKEDLEAMPDALLWFDSEIFNKLISRVFVQSKTTLVFELKCGIRLKEQIVWD